MSLKEAEEAAEREHADGMEDLKQELNKQILEQASQRPGDVAAPAPFSITKADIEQERQRLIERAEAAIRRGWRHVMDAEPDIRAAEGDDFEDDSAESHDEFSAGIESSKASALRRLDELEALVTAFNNARLDVYTALRSDDAQGARDAAASFVHRPAIAR